MKRGEPKAPPVPRCAFPVVGAQNRATSCDRPATTTRRWYGAKLPACDVCAANVDARVDPNDPAVLPLDWSEPIARKRWLDGLRLSFADADAVTRDLLRPLRRRELGHVHHAANYEQARDQIVQALDHADPEPEHGDPAGLGGAGGE